MNPHIAVQRAIASGILPKASTKKCRDCGKPAQVYDHEFYSKPLKVTPVCRSCNVLRGPPRDAHKFKKPDVCRGYGNHLQFVGGYVDFKTFNTAYALAKKMKMRRASMLQAALELFIKESAS